MQEQDWSRLIWKMRYSVFGRFETWEGRIDAIRTIKKISVVQTPTNPQYPLEPRRLYNMIVYILVTLMLAGVVQMLATIIRDHKE